MIETLLSVVVFVIAIAVHESAHAYAAFSLGDTTARDAGRLSLNPLLHLDPVGTVLLPIMLIVMRSPVIFGWARPVPVNPSNFADPRRGMLLTSLAGPGSNFILAVVFAAIFKTGLFPAHSVLWTFLLSGVVINLVLGIFNLMPVPPLDGAGILFSLLPPRMSRYFARIERYGFVILIGFLYLGLFDRAILPLVRFLTRALIG